MSAKLTPSPELLEAIKTFLAWYAARPEGGPQIVGLAARASEFRAALAKAEGK